MAIPSFPDVQRPSRPASTKTSARVLESSFGDGYRQRLGVGLNSVSDVISLSWEMISEDHGRLIDDFLTAQAGVTAFLFSLPGDSAPRKFTCVSWTLGNVGPGLLSVEAEFRQEFDPV